MPTHHDATVPENSTPVTADEILVDAIAPGSATNQPAASRVAHSFKRYSKPTAKARGVPVLATIVSGGEDLTASTASSDIDEAVQMKEMVQRRDTASAELLQLFHTELDQTRRSEILSAASIVGYDANTRMMLLTALAPGQSQELRLAAVAQAAHRDPDLLLGFKTDLDPVVREEIESALSGPQKVDDRNVLTSKARLFRREGETPVSRRN